MALLVVLESLSPAERVAFVLHDVFGSAVRRDRRDGGAQSRSGAAAGVVGSPPGAGAPGGRASRKQHDAVVRAFAAATMTGDLEALTAILDPDVVARTDGGGLRSAARRPVVGADNVARFVLGLIRACEPDAESVPVETPDGLSFVIKAAR